METTVKVDPKAGTVTITLPIEERLSKSKKNTLIATTGGGLKTNTTYKGKTVSINVSAYVPAEAVEAE